jgi:hypothetical protein
MALMWFVSGSRFNDAQERIAELKAEKLGLAREVERLNNFIAWRLGGAPTHPEIEVRPEWMKPGAAPAETREPEEAPTDPIARAVRATGSRNPRAIANHISRQNLQEFSRTMFPVSRTEPAEAKEAVIPTAAQNADVVEASKDLLKALAQ